MTRPSSAFQQARSPLTQYLITLAGMPDDQSGIGSTLVSIARLVADNVAPVDYASVTAYQAGAYTTVAASNDIATAVDEAQYAEGAGPCLDVLTVAAAVAVPDIGATMIWPGFRETAYRLGLRASLSVPLFAGRGTPVAALNLYGRQSAAMAPLTAAVQGVYGLVATTAAAADGDTLDPGSVALVEGLTGAFACRSVIQQAIGVIMAGTPNSADDAYAVLRRHAAEQGLDLVGAASAVTAATQAPRAAHDEPGGDTETW